MCAIKPTILAQCPLAFTVYLLFISAGSIISWSSPMLPKLEGGDSPIPLTSDEGSWVVSVAGFGGLGGPILGLMMDRFGRKPMLIGAAFPIILNWLLIIFATSPAMLMAGRAMSGLGMVLTFVAGPVYMGEMLQEDIRGVLGAMMDFFYNVGYIFSYCVGPYTSFYLFTSLCNIFPIIFVLLMFFMPETPYFLLKKNKREEAQKVLTLIRWNSMEGVKDELNKMEAAVLEQTKEKSTILDLFTGRASRRALIVTMGLVLIQQLSGTTAIISYTQFIFDLTPGLTLSSSECAMIVGGMKLISGLFCISLVDRLGRRILLITSTIGCGFSVLTLGIYLYLYELQLDLSSIRWIPLLCLVVYEFMFSLGLSSVPVVMFGELFASNVKDFAVSLCIGISSLSYFAVTKIFQLMTDSFGGFSSFWLFSAVSFAGSIFVYFLVPETKGKRLDIIISELSGKSKIEV